MNNGEDHVQSCSFAKEAVLRSRMTPDVAVPADFVWKAKKLMHVMRDNSTTYSACVACIACMHLGRNSKWRKERTEL